MPPSQAEFAIVLARRPVSLQTSSKSKTYFKAAVAQAAGAAPPAALLAGPLYLRVLWFCHRVTGDTDNIIKPISDALQAIVYADDNAIAKVASERVRLGEPYTLAPRNAPAPALAQLTAALSTMPPDVLYIEVGTLGSPRPVSCGSID